MRRRIWERAWVWSWRLFGNGWATAFAELEMRRAAERERAEWWGRA